ncbi:uncharacterized protein NFIA_063140 [Aspergillus fischeri NRRL 181]|uniref:Uncharacterized protein n=1 Tax=Neosartorya fischeri (strain ATCC 1020 / DSM 3700 / CBS 544.65 / FGSC A1164 / JCM 1740 / NRRL 181 / WB 181) TaxID=331117 RepID=A1D609_NEOFI|nr:conserved hypothetical protein [Aspergillus fischeri NRRL 181]EAW21153.1 conserved hypothetical protein [Aspergillus fischeri NRRL 181]
MPRRRSLYNRKRDSDTRGSSSSRLCERFVNYQYPGQLVVLLENAPCSNSSSITTSSNSVSTTNTACPTPTGDSSSPSSHDLAIGVGDGVPLGAIALASIAWALWERRQCKYARLESMPATGAQATGQYQHQYPAHGIYQAHPAEMQNRLDIGSARRQVM